jgi:hypothetical protein
LSSNGATEVLNIMNSWPKDCTDSTFAALSEATSMYGTSSMACTRPDCTAVTRAAASESRFQVIAAARAGREPV